ncbi:hypothetical protein, partial [Chryseobacterium sp. MFBS3-17]|uniref:hypothetical protein n=1 Tax=Chryseobacterium sp. MFBS3-17 TaxID=2886689 RepID=UPI001D0F1B52
MKTQQKRTSETEAFKNRRFADSIKKINQQRGKNALLYRSQKNQHVKRACKCYTFTTTTLASEFRIIRLPFHFLAEFPSLDLLVL